MKKRFLLLLPFMGFYPPASPTDFPQAAIGNGKLAVTLLLPDPAAGYYQGTRFDWSGVIKSIGYGQHSFVSQWFKEYAPKKHDAITGPVEEFDAIGYEEARAGGEFIKVGVGRLRKPSDKAYSPYSLYEIADGGAWKIAAKRDRISFTQELKGTDGYAYIYRKTVRLVKGKPQLLLEHSLRNTGTRSLETQVYDHNFFVIDEEPTGPQITVGFPFRPRGTGRGLGTIGEIQDTEIGYLRTLHDNEDMYIGPVSGFGNSVADYDFRIENHRSHAGVRITADRPLAKLVYWASLKTSCPEPYIQVKADPGREFKWTIRYEFYEMPVK